MLSRSLNYFGILAILAGCEGAILQPPDISTTTPHTDPNTQRLVCDDARHPAKTLMHRLSVPQYQHAITELFSGLVQPSAYFPTTYGTSATGYSTEAALLDVGEQGVTSIIRAADAVAISFAQVAPELLPCAADASPGQACLDTYYAAVARKAFRRSLDSEERAALQSTFEASVAAGASFTDALAVVTSQLLQSPQFLYVVEDAAGTGRALAGFELASRLSFLLWDSIPDDELLELAESGALEDAQIRAAQVQRLLASPKADPSYVRFFREWTQAHTLLSTDKNATTYPFFDAAYAQSLAEGFDRFVVAQMHGGGTLNALFTSSEAYVDPNLAASYGVTAPAAGQWAKVSVDGSRYAGLFTQPLLLATNAHTIESSFVFRGRMVQRRLLCTPMGTPPADAAAQFSQIPLPADATARDVASAITANSACAGCHKLLNPPGLAFEHFDGTGRWRDAYPSGKPIDTAGQLYGVSGGGQPFTTPVDLAALVAQRPEAQQCAGAQLFRYTFSRFETQDDGCALQAVQDALSTSGGDLSKALLAMTTTDAFTWRADP